MANESGSLLLDIRQALGTSQQGLGRLLGISRRTAQRQDAGRSMLTSFHFERIARAVHPRDPAFAARMATYSGKTLQELGLAEPPGPPAPNPHIAESVVCAAAEAMDLSPRAVRPALLAAFTRAGELGLSVEMITNALGDKQAKKPAAKPR